MSIASEIQRITGNVADAYTAASGKGATMPATQNSANLASTINTISTGITPTGTKQITANGVYDVTDYASADVQVPTTVPAHYIEKSVDGSGKLINGSSIIDLTGVTDIGDYVLNSQYRNASFPSNTSVSFSSLTNVSGAYAIQSCFLGCSDITSVSFSSLTNVSGSNAMSNCFYACTGITSVDLSSLTTLSSSNAMTSCFGGCTSLTSMSFPSLTTLSGNQAMMSCFQACTSLTSVSFSSLTNVSGTQAMQYCFRSCLGLTSVSFYALDTNSFGSYTNQFNNMLQSVTGCTVHFPMRIQSTIGSWASVTGGFGGTNTTVLFDIVCTLTGADSNTYTRSQKNSTSTATAWTYNDTLYYTSGTAEPQVSDTIYSDSACTTAVTTISSIA